MAPPDDPVIKHQYQLADPTLYATLTNRTSAPWLEAEVAHIDIPDSGVGGENHGSYTLESYQGACLRRGTTYYITLRGLTSNITGASLGPAAFPPVALLVPTNLRDEYRRLLDAEYSEPRLLADFRYFSEFTLEPDSFYFAGRGTVAGREVVRIEYYPTEEVGKERGKRIVQGINKTSLFTFWVDPKALQIVKYTFDNPGLDFPPLRYLVRVDGFQANMEMVPHGDVWMPARITLSGQVASARRDLRVTVMRRFLDYREAATGTHLIDPGSPR